MGCLSDTEIVELIDGTPATAERARILAHLDDCAACRQVLGVAAHTEPDPARPARLALAPGDAVGQRYLVRQAIGAGAMGVVYRATDPRLSRDVALKLLDPRHAADASISPRLLAEAHALARLSHPNVVAIHDVGTHADRVFLAMELGEETFAAWLRRAPRTPHQILRLLRQAGEGLAAAHATGLVHRDFKPANVIIGFDGRAAITDFGLARSQDAAPALDDDAPLDAASLTSTGALVGTPAYMAPEQLRGEACDERSDQFAYCVTVFEALAGQRPFAGSSLAQLRSAAAADRIRRDAARRLPGWVRRIILRGLRSDPAARWPSLRALLDALGRGPPFRRVRVVVATTVGVAVIAVVASLAWGLHQTGRQRARAQQRFNDVRQMATSFMFELHDAIAKLPGATKARALVVQRAQQYLESLAQEAGPGDVSLQRDLARAYHALAEIQGGANSSLGDHRAALASLARAVAIGEAITAADPGDVEATRELAAALTTQSNTERGPARVAFARRALALRETLFARAPGDRKTRSQLASSQLSLGMALVESGEPAAAVEHERAAIAWWRQLAAEDPGDRAVQRNLALGAKYLGGVFQRLDDLAAAGPLIAEAVALDEARVASDPADGDARLDLSYSYGSLAYHHKLRGELDGALAAYQKALALREAMAAADPANATARRAVAKGENSIGRVLRDAGRPAEALAWSTRAAGHYQALLDADPRDVARRLDRAEVHGDVGAAEEMLAGRVPASERAAHTRAACDAARSAEALLAGLRAEAAPATPSSDLSAWLARQTACAR